MKQNTLLNLSIILLFLFFNCDKKNPTESNGDAIETGSVTDIDGNVYQTVKIGDQWWMAENLKVTHYRNGDAIPNVIDSTSWSNITTGAYCNYDNDDSHVMTYGRLYNWYAVNDSRNIAPESWHVPTDTEWQTLVDYLEGEDVAGANMKESGTEHWHSPNYPATNWCGFSALPGGSRNYENGNFDDMGYSAYFWSSTDRYSNSAWYLFLICYGPKVYHSSIIKGEGNSVRCVMD